jgi:glutamate synthase domain-containing protein 3
MPTIDLAATKLRELNARLHRLPPGTNERDWRIVNPEGAHSIAVGLDAPLSVTIDGHVGYYCAGMNKQAAIVINGHCGVGLGENMMSGSIRVRGNASQSAGASAHGGLIVIEGDASSRCAISLKGADIVVGGDVGHMSAFMAQAGRLVVCGDAGSDLGDSLYEAEIFVRGNVASLGADCEEKPMRDADVAALGKLLTQAAIKADAKSFRRYGSARKLYNFHIDHVDQY